MEETEPKKEEEEGLGNKPSEQQPAPSEPQRPMRKPRPKAEDMFADSDPE